VHRARLTTHELDPAPELDQMTARIFAERCAFQAGVVL